MKAKIICFEYFCIKMKYLIRSQPTTYRNGIIKCAIASRMAILLLQFASNLLIPDHDANAFMYPKYNYTSSTFDEITHMIFGGFIRWDAQYFMHIAMYGYTFENTVAFFPLFPLIIRYISLLVSQLVSVFSFESLLFIVSFNFNSFFFVKTALTLYDMTSMFRSAHFAYITSLMFCFNPASIFFSAPYSECLFCYLTFQSFYCCIKHSNAWMQSNYKFLSFRYSLYALICISLSLLTRSNGLLNIVFFVYVYLRVSADKFILHKFSLFDTIVLLAILLFHVLLMIFPFIILQLFDYYMFCSNFDHGLSDFLINHAENNQFILFGSFNKHNQSWCYKSLPIAYSYVQEHYWNVGFLKYYELRNLPNFCLAIPVIYIVLKNSIYYLHNNKHMLIHIGILRKLFGYNSLHSLKENKSNKLNLFLFDAEFASIMHVLFLTIFCILCIHVQVTTRMVFSASPVIYWFCCQMYLYNKKADFIKYYYLLYFIFGTVLFCNFLPWT